MRRAPAPGPVRLATTGIAIVGVTFGMARYGYGLLLPDVRREYGLSPGLLGAIGTGSYVGYLIATALTGALAARVGARATATAAGLIAAAGMAGAALSTGPATFAAAILVAGTAAGPAFAPFSDAAQALQPERRPRVLAAISCGTGYGVALAAPIAIVAGASWRSAWLAFAAVALAASARAWRVLPGRASAWQPGNAAAATWAGLLDPRARRLLATGVLVGLGSSAYWTFGVAQVTGAGGLPPAAGRIFLGVVGVASVLATGTGDLLQRLGVPRAYAAFTTLEAAGLALLALAPGRLAAVLASAVLFGAAYNAAVAVQSIAATELFPERPSLGLSAAMAANGLGLLAGPLGAGLIAGPLGLGAVLAAGALLVAAAGALGPTPRRPRAARASRRPGAPPSARRAPRPAPRPGCAP